MSEQTPLDIAFARISDAQDGEVAHRAYLARLSGVELFLPVHSEDTFEPLLIEQDGAQFALAFDTEARLAQFVDGESYRVIVVGRDLAESLAPAGLGLGINLGVAPSAMLLPPSSMEWVASFSTDAQLTEQSLKSVSPAQLDELALQSLDGFFGGLAGLGKSVHSAQAEGEDGTFPLFVFEGVAPSHQNAIAAALAEHLAMLNHTDAPRVLFDPPSALLDSIKHVALSFDLPQAEARAAPGADPQKPPRLR